VTTAEKFRSLQLSLTPDYGEKEAFIITNMALEKITGKRNNETNDLLLSMDEEIMANHFLAQLLNHRPIQYVLNEAWFQNMKFYVDENVLIPRPETEELVEWIVKDQKNKAAFTILDIGSGSGCIPVSLAKKLPQAAIHSCDISAEALLVAQKNAYEMNAAVSWHHTDFLQEKNWTTLPTPDVIVSNPPYIPQIGRLQMDPHVVDYEPAVALFVPDENALIFYTAIAKYAMQYCAATTTIYVEIHEELADSVRAVFVKAGLTNIEIRNDMQDRERMVKAIRP
jgi:release factor glutamine methyltransferase